MRDKKKCGTGSMTVVAGALGLCALFFLIALCPLTAYAHAPGEVKLVYDMTAQKLEVTVTHDTFFPGFHYIQKIEIKKNGLSAGDYKYESQPTKSAFRYTYDVPAVQGDILEVTATCNISGSKTVKLTVGKQEN